MKYNDWEPVYLKIAEDLNFKIKDDISATKIFNKLLAKKKLIEIQYLKKLIFNKEVIVFGAGPSLEKKIELFKHKLSNKIKISADGATSALIENGILPDIIVTDLDGKIIDQINANSKGSLIIIHAHGDNIETIKKYLQEFKGFILGTIQSDPKSFNYLYNFGGFTDGDRAVFIADYFQAKSINLIGFDYDGKIGKYSFSDKKDKNLKMKKLKWCKLLIDLLKNKNQNIQEI